MILASPVNWSIPTLPYLPLVTEREKIINYDIDHIVSTNIKSNKVNDCIGNELKFDCFNSLSNKNVSVPYL